ncbi:ABC transporter [Macleaya cordata]|uniref:ABC transporter n=1 Tax=Macleaya cordata TaxID=56857 RepID=A0A200R1P4_MACCD|nr:ABC transporter [Macleaya cordata]
MDEKNGLNGTIDKRRGTTSMSHSPLTETDKFAGMTADQQDSETSKGEEEIINIVPFFKLFSFADSKDLVLMVVGTIAALANGGTMPFMSVLFGNLVNSFGRTAGTDNVLKEVSKVALDFTYLAVFSGVASFFQVACWMVTGERQAARIRNLYLKTILRQDIAFFDKETNTGEVVGRMSGDTVLIQDAMGEKVGRFIQLIATFLGGFIIALIKGWLLTLVMVSSIPPLAISSAVMTIFIAKMASRGQVAYSQAGIIVEQTVGSIRTVASFTGEKQAITKYNKSLASAYKSGVQEGLATGLGYGSVIFIAFCSYALAVWFGARMIIDKGYTGGDVINIIVAVLTGSMSLGQASPCLGAFAAGQAAAFKMFETINRKSEIDAYDTNGKILDDIRGDIELRDIYFSYPTRPNEQIFNGFSLCIPRGTTSALVGQSGSGKSTVISLIERFYDPQAGEVLIDGINLKEFQLRWVRERIGLVSQEPMLFTSSIKDNIAYGKDGATFEEIRVAAELANAAKFIDKLPQGLDTLVGEHGTQLSGGQKQRIAIARAILKDPRILLLDEATSALDTKSELIVQEALDRIMVNRTTVIVAHRLSTVKNADMIAVVHQGKIVEKGSHLELLKDPEGAYCQLIRLQEVSRESENDIEEPEIMLDSWRHSSKHMSFRRSISHGSSGQQAQKVPLWRLVYLNKPELPVLLLGIISAAINGVVFPAFSVMLAGIIKTFYEPPSELRKDSRFWAMMFLVLGIVSLVASPARAYFFAVAGCKLITRIRLMCFEKVIHMDIGWFDEPEHSSGAIGARLSADAATVRSLVGDALALLVQNTATTIAGLAIAFEANWQLALIVLLFLPMLGLNGWLQVKVLSGFSADAKMMYEEASQVANDAVGSIRTVASFCAEEKVMKLYEKKCEGPRKTGIRLGFISGIGYGVSFFLLFCVYAASFYFGGRLVQEGKTTFPMVFRVFFAVTMTAIGVSQSSSMAPDSSKAKNSTASIFAILDKKSKIDSSDDSGMTLDDVKGEIEFQHVSFKYPIRPDVLIFRDLCLSIHSGKTVALVGESGSGKSTVISLLQRFYDPDAGQITLDGIEIQKFQVRWLRQQMGLVSQEPILFNDTIRANIAYGKEGNATETETFAAAKQANAHKFISGLQQGYDTIVGEQGIQLSGGQKQRIAIARAIVKEPKILLLDEATSALDAESERVVQDALYQVMVNRTTIVVAHRLTTIMNADLIAVVKNGVICEKGNHDTLIDIKDGKDNNSSGKTADQQESEHSKEEEEIVKTVPFFKLFSFADSKDVMMMVVGTIAALGNGGTMPLMTVLFGQMVDAFGQTAGTKDVLKEVSKVYICCKTLIIHSFSVTCWMVTGERQAARIRSFYLKTILRQDIAFFDKEANTGEVVGRMSGDTVLIQDAMGEKVVGKFIQLTATFLGGFIIAFVKGWLLTLVMLSSIPLLAISGAAMFIFIGKMASRGQTAYSQAGIVVEQTVGSIRTVASFTGENQAITKYNKSLASAYKTGVQEGLVSGLGLGLVLFIMFCSYALAIWFGARMIIEKGYTGGDIINIIVAVLTGSMSLGQASPCLGAFAAGQAAAFKMFETINRKPEIDAYDTSNGKILDDIRGDIELRDVHFSYPARPDEQIFNGFSLCIPSGTTSALVGQSGSGKSTVISLIERFYDPQAGEVLIDGINLKEFQLRWVRGKIGIVSQEPVLFTSSIKDNIAYGKDGATLEEIRVAAELANAAKFIDKLPQGLDTLVGEHGTQLSGGQKQRIAIARAILKNPRILLLDEATSALDAESERIVQEALDRVMVNRTTIIVAHRLSTVRNSDMIAVINQGKIVEKGSHIELLKDPDGAYCQLIRLQEVNKESGKDKEKQEIIVESGRHSSKHMFLPRSISRGSSGRGSSSRHSFSVSFGLPTALNIQETSSEDRATVLLPPKEKAKEVSIRRLLYFNKPELPILLLGVISAAVNGVVFPAFSVMLSGIIKTFYEPPSELRKDARFWALMFILLGVVSLVASPARTYFFAIAGCRLIKRIRAMCFEKVVHMDIGWFDEPEHSSGAIGARLSADAASVRSLVGDALGLLVQNTATTIAGLAIAFEANWQLALIVLFLLPLIGINGWIQIKFVTGFSADAKMMYEEASQVANDAVGSIRTVASFCAEEKVMKLYEKKCEGPRRTGIRQGLISGVGYGVSFFLLFCVYAASFYIGGRLVEEGKTTFPKVFRVFFALILTAIGVSQSSSMAPDSSKAKTSTASIFAILDQKSKIDSSNDSGLTLDDVKGEIEFQHVSFKYPIRPDVQIFRDLCLAIHSGKTVALVGESGSGKSTVISLLQRFYDPDSGHITLDGIEIQKFQVKWLRQQMGLVSQEPVLFNDTIRANIAYGKEGNATETETLAAAEQANAHNFISGLQQGYDTIVGERGVQLSGGQKQRVAIARAIVKGPKILLLDEATSALDAESERVVQNALDRVMLNRTTVVVAHRLTTIKNADVIAVVKNGVIAEKGNHDTLIDIKDGVYASLVALHMNSS